MGYHDKPETPPTPFWEDAHQLTQVFAGSNAGVWEVRFDPLNPGKPLDAAYLSPELKRLIGYEPHEFPDSLSEWMKRTHPQDLPRVEQALMAHFRGESERYDSEYRVLHRDGSYRWMQSRGRIIRNEAGRPIRWLGIKWDITDKKLANEAEARLAALVENSNDAIISATLDGTVTSWNRGAERMFGYRSDEMVGRTLSPIVPEGRWHEVEDILREVARGTDAPSYETVRHTRGGKPVHVMVTTSPIRDTDGTIIGASAIYRDISGRKRMEAELIRTKEAAEVANRAKSDFLANMSHEIRTPLTAITGYTELLLADETLSDEARNYLAKIESNSALLLNIISDVLDLSKIEARKLEIELAPTDPRRPVEDVISHLTTRAESKGLRLNFHWDGPIPESIFTDGTRLQQILNNVIGNAIKFTEHGEVTVIGRALPRDKDRARQLEFEVRDTGPGIPRELVPRLFQPFMETRPSLRRRYGGSGLGLYLSRRLAEALGGCLRLRWTEENRGTCFEIRIDCARRPAAPVSAPELLPGNGEPSQPLDLRHSRILLAEDVGDLRTLLCAFLRQAGAEVETACDGKEALRKVGLTHPHLVLLDLRMPEMGGYEVMRALRNQGYPGKIVALTAHAMKEERQNALRQGFDDYLTKPMERNTLLLRISRLIGSPASRAG